MKKWIILFAPLLFLSACSSSGSDQASIEQSDGLIQGEVVHDLNLASSPGGRIISRSEDYECDGNVCVFDYEEKGFVEAFTAIADDGYVFDGWQGSCEHDFGPCTILLDSSQQILEAHFVVASESAADWSQYAGTSTVWSKQVAGRVDIDRDGVTGVDISRSFVRFHEELLEQWSVSEFVPHDGSSTSIFTGDEDILVSSEIILRNEIKVGSEDAVLLTLRNLRTDEISYFAYAGPSGAGLGTVDIALQTDGSDPVNGDSWTLKRGYHAKGYYRYSDKLYLEYFDEYSGPTAQSKDFYGTWGIDFVVYGGWMNSEIIESGGQGISMYDSEIHIMNVSDSVSANTEIFTIIRIEPVPVADNIETILYTVIDEEGVQKYQLYGTVEGDDHLYQGTRSAGADPTKGGSWHINAEPWRGYYFLEDPSIRY